MDPNSPEKLNGFKVRVLDYGKRRVGDCEDGPKDMKGKETATVKCNNLAGKGALQNYKV